MTGIPEARPLPSFYLIYLILYLFIECYHAVQPPRCRDNYIWSNDFFISFLLSVPIAFQVKAGVGVERDEAGDWRERKPVLAAPALAFREQRDGRNPKGEQVGRKGVESAMKKGKRVQLALRLSDALWWGGRGGSVWACPRLPSRTFSTWLSESPVCIVWHVYVHRLVVSMSVCVCVWRRATEARWGMRHPASLTCRVRNAATSRFISSLHLYFSFFRSVISLCSKEKEFSFLTCIH